MAFVGPTKSSARTSTSAFEDPQHPVVARIPEIDGLRAVAVLTVIAYHFDLYLPGGLLGVDLFFVISGLVISRLLFTQIETGRPTRELLVEFFTRRAWRLVPSLLVTLAVTVLAGVVFPQGSARLLAANAVAAVGGFANWWVGSTAATQGQTLLGHTWSLSIEEQFYLVLPLVLMVGRARATALAVLTSLLLLGASAVTFATTTFDHEGFNRTYFSTFARAIPLACGVLLGVAAHHGWLRPRPEFHTRALSTFFMVLCASLLPALLVLDWNSHWLYRGGFAMVAVVLSGIVGTTVTMAGGNQWVARILRSAPAQWVAARSYTLYLVHFTMVFRFASFGRIGTLVLQLVGTLIGTELLHRFVEEPLRRRGPRTRHASKILPIQALAATAAIIAIVVVGI